METKLEPFGLRVLVEKDNNPMINFGKDIYAGTIRVVPTIDSIDTSVIINSFSVNFKPLTESTYNNIFSDKGILSIGTKITFKYNPEIVDNDGDIYNVPIDLIRSYSHE